MKEIFSQRQHYIDTLSDQRVTVGDDIDIFACTSSDAELNEPIKIDKAIIAVCTSGDARIKVNLQEYEVDSPMIISNLPGQILEITHTSANFKCYVMVMSKRFIDMINIQGWQQRLLSVYNNPVIDINEEQLQALTIFFILMHRAASDVENHFRLQVIENLIRVFYYGGIGRINPSTSISPYKNSLVEKFIKLVHTHYREERTIGFYADHMCITPKYLSKIVKENTGRSAGEWIENHVILEARTLLHSSDMSIQQIATTLNFPNQSFFGKYFKRIMGVSPKQYRQQKH